jgi:hypothetical protein
MFGKRFTRALTVTAVASLVMATAVFADNLQDELAVGSVTNPTITEGGSFSTTVNYQVQSTGAHVTGFPVTVNFALSSAAPTWASLSAPSLSFSGYGVTQSLTVSGTATDGSAGTYVFEITPTTAADNLNPNPAKVSMSVTVEEPSGDTTPPDITITTPADGATYLLNQVVNADYSCVDLESPVTQCAGPVPSGDAIDTSTVGQHTFIVNAASAGGPSTLTNTYSVIYDFDGFFRPIDNEGVLNVAKAGSSIPVKFSLAGDQGLSIMAVGSPSSQKVNCDASAPTDTIETVTAGNSSLSYDALADQYNYVWKTDKAWAGTCRLLTVTLNDGTSHTALFKLTK